MRRAQGEDPSAGRPESREANVCSVGTSTNSPSFLLLSHFISSPAPDSAHRQVRSIWQWRNQGITTVSEATERTSYSPSAMEGDAEEGVDDEDDDDAEPAVDVLEAHMLQYEDYEYHDKTIPCQLPSLYSLWTSVG